MKFGFNPAIFFAKNFACTIMCFDIPAITEVLKAVRSLLIDLSIFSWRNPERLLKGPIKVAHA